MNPMDYFDRARNALTERCDYDFRLGPHAWQRVNKWGTKAIQTRSYQETVQDEINDQDPIKVLAPALGARVLWLATKRVGDLDNDLKALLDAMNKIAYEDDRYIDYFEVLRVHEKAFMPPRTITKIYELNTEALKVG